METTLRNCEGVMTIRRMTRLLLWRFTVCLACISLNLGGCSPSADSRPAKESPSASTAKSADVTASENNWRPWHAEELLADDFAVEEGFQPLNFGDFESFFAKPPKGDSIPTWQQVGNGIVCTGKPKGYLYSKESFSDFTLRLEFRFAPPAVGGEAKELNPNTGVLVYITEPHKQWPKSLEVQGKFSELATIKPNGGAADVEMQDDAAGRESARKPIGEWNALEIISKAGALTARLNGTTVCESRPSDISSGAIGLQSEDFEVHFRRLRLRAD